MESKITLKSITEWFTHRRMEIDFYEENEETRICYHFHVFKDKKYFDLSSQYTTIVGKKDGFYRENPREPYQPELMAKLEAKALQLQFREKSEITRPEWKNITYFYEA